MSKKAVGLKSQRLDKASTNERILLMFAIIIVGFNLRPALTSVGPLLGTIRDQIGLANWSAGTITSLPLIAFAIISPLAPRIGKRLGNIPAILLGLFLLFTGIGIRSIPLIPTLFIGTTIVGVGIAMMNVLLPAVVKDKYPQKVGVMTSIYTTSMAIVAAVGSGLSVPLAEDAGLGWELSLLSWGLLAIIGIIIWIFVIRKESPNEESKVIIENDVPSHEGNLWRSALAWQVTLFMGLQSIVFYVMISWLPEILQSYGFSVAMGGWLVSYIQFVSLPVTFLAPVLAEKFSNQQALMFVVAGFYAVGFIGLFIGGSVPLIICWLTLIGFGSGGAISMSLTLLGMRARNAHQAAQLSGMAQSVGYVLGAAGPLFIGLLFDITNDWTYPLITIIVVCMIMAIVGLGAGRDKYVIE